MSNKVYKRVELYICPDPDCGNYYGGSGMPDLRASFTGPKPEDRGKFEQERGTPHRHNRAECPDCRQRGRAVQRKRVSVVASVDTTPDPAPELPKTRG